MDQILVLSQVSAWSVKPFGVIASAAQAEAQVVVVAGVDSDESDLNDRSTSEGSLELDRLAELACVTERRIEHGPASVDPSRTTTEESGLSGETLDMAASYEAVCSILETEKSSSARAPAAGDVGCRRARRVGYRASPRRAGSGIP